MSEFTRDQLHRETRRSQGARWQTREYDSLGRRTRQQSAVTDGVALPEQDILSRAFRYSARGELAGIHDTLRGQVDYGYDAEGRLLKHYEARQGHASRAFCYDAADNLVDEDALPVRDNRLLHWQQLFMKYDAWGNLIRRRSGQDEQHFSYDAENRLITASGSGPQGRFEARYHYDALGRRTRKLVKTGQGEQATRFLWQGYRLLQEQQGNGSRQTYVYDPVESWSPLARIDHQRDAEQGEMYWFSTDLNGAPLEVTDAGGTVRWSGQYGSFGEVSRQTEGFYRLPGSTSLHHQPLRYAGQYADRETGLHYNLFRYYDPQVGRFTVQDPVGLAGGENLYAYAPNPLTWIDPLGLSKCGVDQARKRQHAMLKNSNEGYNISPKSWDVYPAIGRDGSFISDKQGIMQYFPHVGNSKEITITRARARAIERNMGLYKNSLSEGFKVRKVTGIRDLNPRSPLSGNDYFKGPGQHLPGGAPEMVINSQSTTDNSIINTILTVNVGK